MFAAGRETQGAIARRLGVSRQSVMRWYRAWQRGGWGALRAAGRAGRKPRATPAQLAELDTALRQGPRAQGFRTSLWTLPRVARLIKRLTGVQYHPGHVWRLLGTLNWTVQRPAKRAKERNEVGIRHWIRTRGPAVKKTLRRCAGLVFQDESGVSQRPSVRRPGAPRGETPMLIHAFNWKKPLSWPWP